MARIIEKDLSTRNEFGFENLGKVKITPTIAILALSPILLFVSPVKYIVKNGLLIYILYGIADKYEKTGRIL